MVATGAGAVVAVDFGAVLDAHIVWAASPPMWRPWREESIAPLTPYLNTGMMLIDLAKWREQKLTERTLSFLAKYELPCVDQDAINLDPTLAPAHKLLLDFLKGAGLDQLYRAALARAQQDIPGFTYK